MQQAVLPGVWGCPTPFLFLISQGWAWHGYLTIVLLSQRRTSTIAGGRRDIIATVRN